MYTKIQQDKQSQKLSSGGFFKQNGKRHDDPTMALYRKALSRQKDGKRTYFMGIGKPTAQISTILLKKMIEVWRTLVAKQEALVASLEGAETREERLDMEVEHTTALGYADPQGVPEAREIMASALSDWYSVSLKPEHILFLVGGASGISAIARLLTGTTIVTSHLYYSLWKGKERDENLNLFTFPLLEEQGFEFTAEGLRKGLEEAFEKASSPVRSVLITDPSNPTGRVISPEQAKRIRDLLKKGKYSDILIIIDEAYAEMRYDNQNEKHSLASILLQDPDTRDRVVFLRSATKGLSAAQERLACLGTTNTEVMEQLVNNRIMQYGHPHGSGQVGYAKAMQEFVHNPDERKKLTDYYRPQVELVQKRLVAMGAHINAPLYKPEGSFYAIANLSQLIGHKYLHSASGKRATIKDDQDIAHFLLEEKGLMFCPLSNLGERPEKGYVRITCSEGPKRINEAMDILEHTLAEIKLNNIHEEYASKRQRVESPSLSPGTPSLITPCLDTEIWREKSLFKGKEGNELCRGLSTDSDAPSFSQHESTDFKFPEGLEF